jgi:hypothetical protein
MTEVVEGCPKQSGGRVQIQVPQKKETEGGKRRKRGREKEKIIIKFIQNHKRSYTDKAMESKMNKSRRHYTT